MQYPNKNSPSPEWIQAMRQRFPTEQEVDHVLTRRQQRRSGPAYQTLSLPEVFSHLGSLLNHEIGSDFKLSNARWLSGGASKVQMAFELDWDRPGVGHEKTGMVLRMEPAESIVETSRIREFQLIKNFNGVVPVPPVFWCDAEGKHMPYPAMIYGFANGVTKPSDSSSGVTGVGTCMPEAIRGALAEQFVEYLCNIHAFDYSAADFSAFDVPAEGTQCALWLVNTWDRIWEEDFEEDVPLIRVISAWLRRNLPTLDAPAVIHADYRTGNYLYTENNNRITAILDWELGHIGDRHQDLAWTTSRAFGSLAEDGKTFLVGGMMSEQAFFDAYEKASGFHMNPKTLHWYKVYNSYTLASMTLSTAYRAVRNGKTHQDVLVAWLIGLGYGFLDEIRVLLEEGY